MSASAKTVLYFSYYLFLTGVQLVFVPNMFTKLFLLPDTTEPWIRVVGILVLIIGFYYHQVAGKDLTEFLKLTVYGRAMFFVGATALVIFGIAPAVFIGFGLIDFLGAFWTRQSLKKENKL
jgi:membrane-bound ClpP family serine protease